MIVDNELKDLAMLALRNAFYRDFSALCNAYLEAAEGLDVETQERMMGEITSIYGRDTKARGNVSLNIWTQNRKYSFGTTGHRTILEALRHHPAIELHLQGEKVFEEHDGEWYYNK